MKWVINMIYVLTGKERFMIDEKIKDLKKEYQCNEDSMNYTVYYGDTPCMEEVYDDYCTVPFFSEHKMIVLFRPAFLTTKKGSKSEDEELYLLKCIENQNDFVTFVIVNDEEDLDNRKKVVKKIKSDTKFIQYDKLSYFKLKEIARNAIRNKNCDINEEALELLLERTNGDMMLLSNECSKLSLYKEYIELDDVFNLVSRPIEDRVFELSAAIVKKDLASMISVYRDLITLNQEPVALILMIANKMRALYQVKVLLRKGYTDKEITSMLSLNPYYFKKLKQEVFQYEIDELIHVIGKLHELDYGIKSGLVDKKLGLELFMLKL